MGIAFEQPMRGKRNSIYNAVIHLLQMNRSPSYEAYISAMEEDEWSASEEEEEEDSPRIESRGQTIYGDVKILLRLILILLLLASFSVNIVCLYSYIASDHLECFHSDRATYRVGQMF